MVPFAILSSVPTDMSEMVPLQAVLSGRMPTLSVDATAAGRRGCPLSDLRERLRRAGLRPTASACRSAGCSSAGATVT